MKHRPVPQFVDATRAERFPIWAQKPFRREMARNMEVDELRDIIASVRIEMQEFGLSAVLFLAPYKAELCRRERRTK